MAKKQLSMESLALYGITGDDAYTIYRAACAIARWNERLCGVANGCIECPDFGQPFWRYSDGTAGDPVRDTYTPACRRITETLKKYNGLAWYEQSDPRGMPVYIYRIDEVGDRDIRCCYSSVGRPVG